MCPQYNAISVLIYTACKISITNDQAIMDYDDGQCAICLLPHVYKSRLLCGHVFCFKCLSNWCRVKFECPSCRRKFNSFITSDIPVNAFQNNANETTRIYCSVPDVIPHVLNVPIDANSRAMTRLLFNGKAFVDRILRTYQFDFDTNIVVNLLIWNEPETDEYRRDFEQSVRRAWPSTSN